MKLRLAREFARSILVAIVAIALLLAGMWMFVRYHEVQQTELAGYSTAKALAEQVSVQRRIYAEMIVPRAQRAGMNIDVEFETNDNTLPLPVTLVNVVGASLAKEFPGSRLRLYSRYPFAPRKQAELDSFESEALAAVEASPGKPFFRLERREGKKVVRYAIADVMSPECVDCHNHHPRSPRRDWHVGDVRGAVEVTLPVDDLAARIHAEQLNVSFLVLGGGLFFCAALAVLVRHDLRRIRREEVALTDPTTGLYARRGALPLIAKELARARRHRHPLSFIMLDVDHFKRINDRHGHALGDRILTDIARILSGEVRQFDIVARWGGEEFLAVLPHVGAEGAREIAERLRQKVRASETGNVSVTISAGVSELGADDTLDSVIANADARLYEAKEGGRDSVR